MVTTVPEVKNKVRTDATAGIRLDKVRGTERWEGEVEEGFGRGVVRRDRMKSREERDLVAPMSKHRDTSKKQGREKGLPFPPFTADHSCDVPTPKRFAADSGDYPPTWTSLPRTHP